MIYLQHKNFLNNCKELWFLAWWKSFSIIAIGIVATSIIIHGTFVVVGAEYSVSGVAFATDALVELYTSEINRKPVEYFKSNSQFDDFISSQLFYVVKQQSKISIKIIHHHEEFIICVDS